MAHDLIVLSAFDGHARGDRITDDALIATIEADPAREGHVMRAYRASGDLTWPTFTTPDGHH